ncbi:MAG TPA: hypothetical protein VGM82_17720 [Gemmatimonadaceae bacterium]
MTERSVVPDDIGEDHYRRPDTQAGVARLSLIRSARDCMVRAVAAASPNEPAARDFHASDETVRQLSACVREYARVLRGMGEPAERVPQFLRRAVTEAVAPNNAHPALIAAIVAWAAEDTDDE